MKRVKRALVILSGGLAAIGLAACSNGGSGSTSSASGSGTAAFAVSDAPSCGGQFTSAVVDVTSVSAIGPDGATHTLSLPAPGQSIDLLQQVNGQVANLGALTLGAGTYSQIRLQLATNPSGNSGTPVNYVTKPNDPTLYPLTTPSAQESGYKVQGSFTVGAGQSPEIVLDFNACRSIVTAGNSGKFLLKPVIQAASNLTTGGITGTAAPGSMIFAEDAKGIIYKTTVADPTTGNFTLSQLAPTVSGAPTYNVVVVPPQPAASAPPLLTSDVPDIVFGVPVTAGALTNLTGTFPVIPETQTTNSGTIALASQDADVLVLAQETVAEPQPATQPVPTSVVTIAESLAQPATTSGNTTSSYTLSYSSGTPQVAMYSPSAPVFTPATPVPAVSVNFFGSDGSTATLAPNATPPNVTMQAGSDTTYSNDN